MGLHWFWVHFTSGAYSFCDGVEPGDPLDTPMTLIPTVMRSPPGSGHPIECRGLIGRPELVDFQTSADLRQRPIWWIIPRRKLLFGWSKSALNSVDRCIKSTVLWQISALRWQTSYRRWHVTVTFYGHNMLAQQMWLSWILTFPLGLKISPL